MHWITVLLICVMLSSLLLSWWKGLMLTQTLLVANMVVFVAVYFLSVSNDPAFDSVLGDLVFKPKYLGRPDKIHTMFTCLFMHGDFFHIFSNMLFLGLFGLPFEERMGRFKFGLIYITAGFGGNLVFSFSNWMSGGGLVGASGSIFGIMGAFALLYPRVKIMVPIPLLFIMLLRPVQVVFAALFYALLETIYISAGTVDNVAHTAHLGGFVFGAIMAAILGKGMIEVSTKDFRIELLEPLAITPELRQTLQRIKVEDEFEVQRAWVEKFIYEARCPICDIMLNEKDVLRGTCAEGHRFLKEEK